MSAGEFVVLCSVWVAVLCYPAGPAGRRIAPIASRLIWTFGAVAFIVHVIAAFHVHYQWSHVVALDETARQTAEMTGRNTGTGLYLNYLFALLWLLDAGWWWRDGVGHRSRPKWVHLGLHGFMLFMLINGAVVFVASPMRWLGLVVSLVALVALIVSVRHQTVQP